MAKTDIGVMSLLRTKFEEFGRTLGVKLPYDLVNTRGLSNVEADQRIEKHNLCLDFARAQMLQSVCKKDVDVFKAQMVERDLLGDYDNLTPGTTHLTYESQELYVTVKVNNNGIAPLDEDAFRTELAKTYSKSTYDEIVSIMRKCTPRKQGARTITVQLKEQK